MTEALDYLSDILDAVRKIEQYTTDMDDDEFAADEKTVDAVLRNFEVIGEAVKNVPKDVRQEYPAVPWSEMAGMRDKLIHGYATVELQIIWETIEAEIPALRPQIEQIRDELSE